MLIAKLLQAKRSTKRFVSLLYDVSVLAFALYLSISLRLGEIFIHLDELILTSFIITLLSTLFIAIRLGLYRAILRYAPLEAIFTIAIACTCSAVIFASSSFFLEARVPRSSPIIFLLASVILLGTPRMMIRGIISISLDKFNVKKNKTSRTPVIIYGAGYSGYQLALALQHNPTYKVVCFVDDDAKLDKRKIHGLTIYPTRKLEDLTARYGVENVLLALGSAPKAQKTAIIEKLEGANLKALTIPPIADIMSGKAQIADIKPVQIEDLLGRDPVKPIPELLHACIKDKSVMITGAGGSIGSELCRQIIKLGPKRLIMFELNEFNLYRIDQDIQKSLNTLGSNANIETVALLGSVQDKKRLEHAMNALKVDTVYHAAAYKHVPIVEHNIVEGVKNNIFGTWNCAEAAINTAVSSFVLISTDKAVRPTNIMGTTKRVAELVLQGLAQRQSKTRFSMVRFGNVLGSSGSVVPLFRKQIAAGGPITVTHPDIIRFFMTIPEAAELVIQAGSMAAGGDVFVLDMGEPVKIYDLAKRMIRLSGLKIKNDKSHDGDIEINFTGLRPGEKLFEELLIGDNASGTVHPRIMRAEEKFMSWQETESLLTQLMSACDTYQCDLLKELLTEAPTDFQSSSKIHDSLWSQDQIKLMEKDNIINLITH